MTYERTCIERLTAYAPGEQPNAASDTGVIKLNTNENPYPPCQAVLEAIQSVTAESLRRYPPPDARAFREAAAGVHGLDPEQVIATNGGDELLRLALTVFCEPTGSGEVAGRSGGVGFTDPTYSLYPVLAQIQDTPVTRVPLTEDFALPDHLTSQLNDAGCRLALIVNPHAPSGRLRPLRQLEAIAKEFHGVLLIDEAYVDFASNDALPLLAPDSGLDNVLILRSLSKGYSLAGLRFGYGLGHRDLIAALHKARDSYNTDALSQAAAVAALQHRHETTRHWQAVIDERNRLTHELTTRGYHVYPSETNFLLVTPSGPAKAKEIYPSLKEKKIFVRYFDQPRLADKLRITVGTPQQNDHLLAALTELDDLGDGQR